MPTSCGDNVYAVILAGGSGTRFWPKSRHLRPKQLSKIGPADKTMLEITLARLDGFIPPERRLIVTHKDQLPLTKEIVGRTVAAVIGEPEAKNTANALALAALEIEKRAPAGSNPVMVSLHADHLIRDVAGFLQAIEAAVHLAESGYLTLLGVVPEYAETGYGYIEQGEALKGGQKVASFREKPERKIAEEYVKSGRFYWNAGLFVWRTGVLLKELERVLKPTIDQLRSVMIGSSDLGEVYRGLPKISIDHAVLETSKNVAVVPMNVGWQDVGSWDSLSRGFPTDAQGNLAFGDACLIETKGTTVDSDGPFVAALGLTDMVVVAAQGAVLVCPKDRAQDVKKIVDWLSERGRKDLV